MMDDQKRFEEYERMDAAYWAEPVRPTWAEFCARWEEDEAYRDEIDQQNALRDGLA